MKFRLLPTRETKNYIVFQTEGYDDWSIPGAHIRAHMLRIDIEGTVGPIEITIAPILVVDEPLDGCTADWDPGELEANKDDIPW